MSIIYILLFIAFYLMMKTDYARNVRGRYRTYPSNQSVRTALLHRLLCCSTMRLYSAIAVVSMALFTGALYLISHSLSNKHVQALQDTFPLQRHAQSLDLIVTRLTGGQQSIDTGSSEDAANSNTGGQRIDVVAVVQPRPVDVKAVVNTAAIPAMQPNWTRMENSRAANKGNTGSASASASGKIVHRLCTEKQPVCTHV